MVIFIFSYFSSQAWNCLFSRWEGAWEHLGVTLLWAPSSHSPSHLGSWSEEPGKQLLLYFNIVLSYASRKTSTGCDLVAHFFLRIRFATFAGSLAAAVVQSSPFFMSTPSMGTQVAAQGNVDRCSNPAWALTQVELCALDGRGLMEIRQQKAGHLIQRENS